MLYMFLYTYLISAYVTKPTKKLTIFQLFLLIF